MNTPATLLPPAAPPRRHRALWLLLAASACGLLLLGVLGTMAWQEIQGPQGLAGLAEHGHWHFGIDEDGWHGDGGPAGVIVALAAVSLAVLVVAVVVPLVLLGTGLAVGLALTLAALSIVGVVALGLAAAMLALLVLSSPLWIIGLVLWRTLKPAAVASPAKA